jgi:hypothetical protein
MKAKGNKGHRQLMYGMKLMIEMRKAKKMMMGVALTERKIKLKRTLPRQWTGKSS